ncbi:MAG: lysophospholipid acyltransferase family protein [Candidatus Latescibacterota bacterium]|nr:MAG: lysophospholipid acyltransferase family protein [Candidatus Latescibacterota bacterium]
MANKTQEELLSTIRPLPLSRRIRHRIEYLLTELLISVCSVVPLGALRRVGGALGWLGWRVFGIRRRVVTDNLDASLPDSSSRERERIAIESYKNMGRALMEFAAFRGLSAEKLLGMVDIEGLENFDKALEHGNGAILFTGHFGNWELLGAVIARCGYPIHVTDTNHSNKLVHEIISDLRTRQGMRIISPSEPLTRITQLLSENQFVAYLADQDARRDGIFVDFLGRPASTVRGPAIFSIRKKCPIVPGFLIRKGRDRHRAIFEKPLWPDERLVSGEAVLELTQRFTTLLERYVREYPEQYFWTHRRWKTRPDGRVVR